MEEHFVESKPRCPNCHTTLDCASCPFEKAPAPKPGDFTICLCCGAIMRYTDNMQLKICDEDDIKEAIENNIGEELLKLSKVVAPIAKEIQRKNITKN